MGRTRFDVEALDPEDPFEVDRQLTHLYKHEGMDICDVYEVWIDSPLFYAGREDGPADWLMVGEVPGDILVVPLAPARRATQARPIGVYKAMGHLDRQYRQDSR